MNRAISSFLLLLMGGMLAAQAQAQALPDHQSRAALPAQAERIAQNTPLINTPPANNPIRRINPNSRQGTGDSVPGARAPSTAPIQPRPSIENGQIGNGYPRSQTPPKPAAPPLQPRDEPY
ncbi:hypothetical protein SAMN04489800_3356 [Pseudomonas deceptionensis]|uniref:Lipoprotein n=1 Tax=Pseudomonas deceptionensis TaxID=882211 RepID=A0A1H5NAQ4_PSEDM|nr:hypothetical protein SAMN04489800_3356 [Pseudomonas deceptionensis]